MFLAMGEPEAQPMVKNHKSHCLLPKDIFWKSEIMQEDGRLLFLINTNSLLTHFDNGKTFLFLFEGKKKQKPSSWQSFHPQCHRMARCHDSPPRHHTIVMCKIIGCLV